MLSPRTLAGVWATEQTDMRGIEKWARRIGQGETGYSQKGSVAITSRVPDFKTIRTPFQLEGRSTHQL